MRKDRSPEEWRHHAPGGVAFTKGRAYLLALEFLEVDAVVGSHLAASGARILVVEDEQDNREVLVDLLDLVGYDARGAADGREALSVLNTSWRPDLMILDLTMPGMNGWELLAEMKKVPDWQGIRKLVVSAVPPRLLPTEDVDATLSKPVLAEQLLALIERFTAAHTAAVA